MISGLDIHYGPDGDHPMIGRRIPDLEVTTSNGPTRIFKLLHHADPLFLDLDLTAALPAGPWCDRIKRIDATYNGIWELPVLGEVAAPSAVLIRPDGYVAWAGNDSVNGLDTALDTWFGA